jgi:hypothetical protein
MTAGPIAEEAELLFFNAVFHLPSSTVNLIVDLFLVIAEPSAVAELG